MGVPVPREYVLIAVGVASRHVLLDGLSKLDYGFADDIAAALEATICESCGGHGQVPYVGGDEDDAPCTCCRGTGHRKLDSALLMPDIAPCGSAPGNGTDR